MKMKIVTWLNVVVSLKLIIAVQDGQMKPLGEQRPSEGHIEIINELPNAEDFFNNYIKGSKPVVFKGFAKHLPAFNLWNDDYLIKTYGDVKVSVEEGKKENRSLNMWTWPFKRFLNTYKNEDVYMVHSLPKIMRGDLRLFPFLSCGGYANVLTDVIMWFSSGGTKSVLHSDGIDNVNCLFSGTKTLYMVDHKYEEHIKFDAPEGAYSKVDVDAVDLKKYPGLAKAPWWSANMEAGDCIFIPSFWYHQVRSYATDKRNMAVNLWFYHMNKINLTDCKENESKEFNPLDRYHFLKKAEDVYKATRFLLSLEVEGKSLSYKEMVQVIKKHNRMGLDRNYIKNVIRILDQNRDRKISIEDIEKLEDEDMEELMEIFPNLSSVEESEDEENSTESEINKKSENNVHNNEITGGDVDRNEDTGNDVDEIFNEDEKIEL